MPAPSGLEIGVELLGRFGDLLEMFFGQVRFNGDFVFLSGCKRVVVCQCNCCLERIANLSAVPDASVGGELIVMGLGKLEDTHFIGFGHFDIFSFFGHVVDVPFPDFAGGLEAKRGVVEAHVYSRFEGWVDCTYSIRCEEEDSRVVF